MWKAKLRTIIGSLTQLYLNQFVFWTLELDEPINSSYCLNTGCVCYFQQRHHNRNTDLIKMNPVKLGPKSLLFKVILFVV